MATIINASTSAGLVQTADTSGNLNLQSNGSTIVAVSSTGAAVTGTLSASGGIAKASLPTGSVLQVVNNSTDTSTGTTSTSYVTSSLTATITPTSATSKILIFVSLGTQVGGGANGIYTVFRGTVAGTNLISAANGFGLNATSGTTQVSVTSGTFLDSPATTSATTYTVGIKSSAGGTLVYAQAFNTTSTITLMEIAA